MSRVEARASFLLLLITGTQSFQLSPRQPQLLRQAIQKNHKYSPQFSITIRNERLISRGPPLNGWIETGGEWNWQEDDPTFSSSITADTSSSTTTTALTTLTDQTQTSTGTPKLPSGSFKPKQSLGQNFLRDGNTVGKIVRAFAQDISETLPPDESRIRPVELGPGAGALTFPLVKEFGEENLHCIEIDSRSVSLLTESFPNLDVTEMDVLQADYPAIAARFGGPLSVIGNLPYYITSQILFALADASHFDAVRSASVTMQWEVALRIVADTHCKDYGILSIVFQLYTVPKIHFKIPPTVFYPKPKVDSALIGLHFLSSEELKRRLGGVNPRDLRKVMNKAFLQRRKTVRNSLKKMALEIGVVLEIPEDGGMPVEVPEGVGVGERGDFRRGARQLPANWLSMRPEELNPGQWVELARFFYGPNDGHQEGIEFDRKVWRKKKHGVN